MFLKLIFRKLGVKENKYFLALIYGMLYFVFILLLLTLSSIYLKKLNLTRDFFISLILGVVMSIVYLIKWEIFKFR